MVLCELVKLPFDGSLRDADRVGNLVVRQAGHFQEDEVSLPFRQACQQLVVGCQLDGIVAPVAPQPALLQRAGLAFFRPRQVRLEGCLAFSSCLAISQEILLAVGHPVLGQAQVAGVAEIFPPFQEKQLNGILDLWLIPAVPSRLEFPHQGVGE
jgi:hypothetical protein